MKCIVLLYTDAIKNEGDFSEVVITLNVVKHKGYTGKYYLRSNVSYVISKVKSCTCFSAKAWNRAQIRVKRFFSSLRSPPSDATYY